MRVNLTHGGGSYELKCESNSTKPPESEAERPHFCLFESCDIIIMRWRYGINKIAFRYWSSNSKYFKN